MANPRTATDDTDVAIDSAIVAQAVAWFVKLSSGQITDNDRRKCSRWREDNPEHERAWQRLALISHKLKGSAVCAMPDDARNTLLTADRNGLSRRGMLKALTGVAVIGSGAWLARDTNPGQHYLADHHTATGEQRTVVLADGTRVLLNTATAIDVVFDEQKRVVHLRAGEIQVTTAVDSARREFRVVTGEGSLIPIGTRFIVRHDDNEQRSYLGVIEGTVEVCPANSPQQSVRVTAGRQTTYTRSRIEPSDGLSNSAASWVDGVLAAERMRLGDFIQELNRYRPGWLRCAPAVADLRLTGSFPLNDTDRILAALEQTLPVKITTITPYWVNILPKK